MQQIIDWVNETAPPVSILTRPGGRVQLHRRDRRRGGSVCFNPHPSRRTGATHRRRAAQGWLYSFNPHPSRRTGATHLNRGMDCLHQVSILTRPGGRVQRVAWTEFVKHCEFQSSPVPEDGCNDHRCKPFGKADWFQSSPVPEDGCNMTLIQEIKEERKVSILTRPGGRVQP